jgi:hypothetical protein
MFTDDTISMVLVSLNVDMWYPSLDLQMIPPSNSYMPPPQNQMCPNDTTKMKVSFIVWLMLGRSLPSSTSGINIIIPPRSRVPP